MPTQLKDKKQKLPKDFKWLFGEYKFENINTKKDRILIIVDILNDGGLRELDWMFKVYNIEEIYKVVRSRVKSEFNSRALGIISNRLGIKKFRFQTRSEKIQYLLDRGKIVSVFSRLHLHTLEKKLREKEISKIKL